LPENCFTIEAITSTGIMLNSVGSPDNIALEYSTDGVMWKRFYPNATYIVQPAGHVAYIKANGANSTISKSEQDYYQFSLSGSCRVSGSIMTLLDSKAIVSSVPEYCFYGLFKGCEDIESAPELPALTLSTGCYAHMFEQCVSLQEAPELPATSLAEACYAYMFSNCQFDRAPNLPAKDLSASCYEGMFEECYALKEIDVSFTSWNAATSGWVKNANNTGVFKCPFVLAKSYGENRIPSGWDVEYTDNFLTFTAEVQDVHVGMKSSSITVNPPSISLEYSSDLETWSPFTPGIGSGTTHLTLNEIGDKVYIRANNSNTTFGEENLAWMFSVDKKCAVSGNVMSLLDHNTYNGGVGSYGFYALFSGCKITSAPDLTATSLGESCYEYMFEGCSELVKAPDLPATILKRYCYHAMFMGCSKLVIPPDIQAESVWEGCCCDMFSNCTSLSRAPVLKALHIYNRCYASMFHNCSSLSYVEVKFGSWNDGEYATFNWLNGVSASGIFRCPSSLPDIRDESHIPEGWERNPPET